MDDVRFHDEVVVEKVYGKVAVRVQAANSTGGNNDHFRTMRIHPIFDVGLSPEVEPTARCLENELAMFSVQPTHQCASDHPILACNPNTLASDFERHGGFLGCDAP